jgi:Holliday junction resolvase RusA-like endonuclease
MTLDSPRAVRMSFFVHCVPPKVSHHHKRIVKIGNFSRLADRPELNAAKQSLDAWFLPHQPPAALGGPIVLDIELIWPWLAGDSKKVRALGRIPHDSKPDWDNAAKGIADCLARLRFIDQDSRVVDGRVRKWRGDVPGIAIRIASWEAQEVA